MKILLSPAKSIDYEYTTTSEIASQPAFLSESERLVKKLSKLSARQIKKLMSVSDDIAAMNEERFKTWHTPFTTENAKQAVFMFTGEAYRGLNAREMSQRELEVAQDKLRILSGLYGIIKPMDLIQPYRLEMGTRFKVTPKVTNLYKYWGDKLVTQLNEELDGGVLVNVASNEYSKAVNLKQVNGEVVNCSFKEAAGDDYKTVMVYAKHARGAMARYIITNNIEKKEDLKGFDFGGYAFNNSLSADNEFVFTRIGLPTTL